VVAAAGIWLSPRPVLSAAAAGLLVVTGLAFLWRGRVAGRSVLPGVGAGLVPLTLTLLVNGIVPGCPAHGCTPYCTYACVVGGVVAGAMLVRFARHEAWRTTSWALGSCMAALTGSLGCGCVDYLGVLGMVGALLLTGVPSLAVWARQPR
jgi:hypothetical protein